MYAHTNRQSDMVARLRQGIRDAVQSELGRVRSANRTKAHDDGETIARTEGNAQCDDPRNAARLSSRVERGSGQGHGGHHRNCAVQTWRTDHAADRVKW